MRYHDLLEITDSNKTVENYSKILFLRNELYGKLGGKFLTISGFLKLREAFRENQLNIMIKNIMKNDEIEFLPLETNYKLPAFIVLANFIETEKNLEKDLFSEKVFSEDAAEQIQVLSTNFLKIASEIIHSKKADIENSTFTLIFDDYKF
jgi:hypothetical protein